MKELQRKILLNPGPGTTSQRVKEALLVEDICPRETEFGSVLHEICDGLVKIGNGEESHEACLFGSSGTGAVEAILTAALGEGRKVLIVTNGAYGYRMKEICETYGLAFETVHHYGEFPDTDEIRRRLQTGKFTHLAMIHHETSTGMMNPLERLAEIGEETGVRLIVDAMSSYGGYPIDLRKTRIHYLSASSNKCIHGMAGLSFVVFRNNCVPEIERNSKSYYFNLYKQWRYLQQKSQLRFTPPVQVAYAFREAIKETLAETVERRWQRYQANWTILYEAMKGFGFEFFLPYEQQSKILMALKLDAKLPKGFDHFHDYLFQRNITVYPGVIPETKTFRMAVIGDLFEADMFKVTAVIEEYLNKY